MKKDSQLSWGVTLLFFGVLFLLKVWGQVPRDIAQYVFDIRNFPIVIGIIFLIFHKIRAIGFTLIVLGIFMRFDEVMKLTNSISPYIWPALLILAGGIMIFGFKKGK